MEKLFANSDKIALFPLTQERLLDVYYQKTNADGTISRITVQDYLALGPAQKSEYGEPMQSNIASKVHNGRSLTEANLRLFFTKANDSASFIINNDSSISYIEFILDGYYCYLNDSDLLSKSNLWVSYKKAVDTSLGFDSMDECIDSLNKFMGLTFTETVPEDPHTAKLELIRNGRIPLESYSNIEYQRIKKVDGGIV